VVWEWSQPQLAAGSMFDDFVELLDGWFIYLIEPNGLNAFVDYGDSAGCMAGAGNYIASREQLILAPAASGRVEST
jgi:hypothetical protein